MLPSFRIDAHQHLWRYSPAEFGWLNQEMGMLRRDFLSPHLDAMAQSEGIAWTVAVQARASLQENSFLLECAQASHHIAGIVGWAPLCDPHVAEVLDPLCNHAIISGIREFVQSQPAGYLSQPSFSRGLRELTERDLTFDLLLRKDQLAEATALVDRHPAQRFVLDHAAKPAIRAGELEPWAADLQELARRPNVTCKLSGFVTEADWQHWTPDQLRPYLDLCVAAFGPARLMAGSDWPVCLVATESRRWWNTLDRYFADFTPAERDQVFAGTAKQFYRLQAPHGSAAS